MNNPTATERLKRKTICIPKPLFKKAETRAKSDNRNFSSYVQSLISRDLESKRKTATA